MRCDYYAEIYIKFEVFLIKYYGKQILRNINLMIFKDNKISPVNLLNKTKHHKILKS